MHMKDSNDPVGRAQILSRVLKAVTKMSMEWIKPSTRRDMHPYIENNQRYWPYFKVRNVWTRVVVYIFKFFY